jgi:hypothetical protein
MRPETRIAVLPPKNRRWRQTGPKPGSSGSGGLLSSPMKLKIKLAAHDMAMVLDKFLEMG